VPAHQSAAAPVATPATIAAGPETQTDARPVTTPDDRAAKYRATLADAKELRSSLLRDLAHGEAREDALLAIDSEIADLEKRIAWIEEARAMESRRNSKEAQQQRYANTRTSLQAGIDSARELGKDAEKLLARIAELGNALQAMEVRSSAIRERFAQAIRDAKLERNSEIANTEKQQLVDSALAAITLPDHALRALFAAGVGRTGVKLPREFFELRPFTGITADAGKAPAADVIDGAVQRLISLGTSALKKLKPAEAA
jgi:hypothetical protein